MVGTWSRLGLRGQVLIVAATLGVFLAVLFLARAATAPGMSLLYAGLEPAAAGEVVAALEAQGATVEVRGNAIYVDSAQRDALRLSLASNGLPTTGGRGYEILDTLTGFGTTSQMFDAAYWRAKEGELARTIASSRHITAARVHLSTPSSNPFERGQIAGASVAVTTAGGPLAAAQASALRHLVASAVAGLDAKDVTLLDSRNGLIPTEDSTGGSMMPSAATRAETLKANVKRLLEARVGAGNAIVEVNVETVTEREAITERFLNPDSRIAISSDTEETTTSANDSSGGAVTVASNLPEGDAGGSGQSSQSNETRTREVINYEISETQRDVVREPGTVKRVSVAVLVNGLTTVNLEGQPEWTERTPNEIEDLRALVASTVGFDEARGDAITIRSMQFEALPAVEPPLPPTLVQQLDLDFMSLIQIAALAIVSLVLGLFVIRPLLTSASRSSTQALPAPTGGLPNFDELPPLDADFSGGGLDLGDLSPRIGALPSHESENPSARLRRLIEDRKDESVEILSQWMNDGPESAK